MTDSELVDDKHAIRNLIFNSLAESIGAIATAYDGWELYQSCGVLYVEGFGKKFRIEIVEDDNE